MWFRIRLMADEDRIIYESVDYDMKMMMTFSIITRHWLRLPGLGNNKEKLGLPISI
jgi:hypothetical protein